MYFSYTTIVILAYSIYISGILGLIRFKHIRDVYKPFIYLIWVGCCNETLTYFIGKMGYYTYVNGAIYELLESLLLLWFFKRLGVFKRKYFLQLLIILFVSLWVAETFFAHRFGTSFTYYYNAVYFFFIVILSIQAINDLLFTEKELLKNPTFLICVGLIIFFTYGIIVRMFWLFGLNISNDFVKSVHTILIVINLLANLIYALAVLWMRKRQAFTLRF